MLDLLLTILVSIVLTGMLAFGIIEIELVNSSINVQVSELVQVAGVRG